MSLGVDPSRRWLKVEHDQDDLTPTERDRILPMLLRGRTDAEMAEESGTGLQTVKSHVAHIVRKLTFGGNRAKAVYAALRRGLVRMP